MNCYISQIIGSSSVTENFMNALNLYLPPNAAGYNAGVNDAVEFVQDAVSGGHEGKLTVGLGGGVAAPQAGCGVAAP